VNPAAPTRVQARSLVKRFGPVTALGGSPGSSPGGQRSGVDLDLVAGEALAVLGPNGAGKSTLLRILAGLSRPTSGELRVERDGAPASGRGGGRGWVGFAGHATLLYPELTARENLVFHGRVHGIPDPGARADALLAEEGLAAVADRRAGTFSRGMAQRLSIARALVHDPPIVLLDEPFTGMDRRAGDRLSRRLRGLRDEDRVVVLVTHDLPRASEIADRAIVMLAGRIVAEARGQGLERDALEAAYLAAIETEGAAA
jgi:heme exporter protein A